MILESIGSQIPFLGLVGDASLIFISQEAPWDLSGGTLGIEVGQEFVGPHQVDQTEQRVHSNVAGEGS